MVRFGICLAMAAALAACGGGDFCALDVGSIAGTYEVSFVAGGDSSGATVIIDDDGNVSLDTQGDDDWACDLVRDQVCDLNVHCKEQGGSNEFNFTLKRK